MCSYVKMAKPVNVLLKGAVIKILFFTFLIYCCNPVLGRIHTLKLKNDARQSITMSTFGFYKNGWLEVNMTAFSFAPYDVSKVFGFSLEKTITDATSAYLQNHQDKCLLETSQLHDDSTMSVILFTLDLKHQILVVNCSQRFQNIHIYPNNSVYKSEHIALLQQRSARDITSDTYLLNSNTHALRRSRKAIEEAKLSTKETGVAGLSTKPLQSSVQNNGENAPDQSLTLKSENNFLNPQSSWNAVHISIRNDTKDGVIVYGVNFLVAINREDEEGLYNLNFHNCPNYHYMEDYLTAMNLTVTITEINDDNYLSAGEMPLPALYFTMSILFFLSGCFWIFILRKSNREDAFKIHYVMGILVYLKSFSLLFHGIHYHCIQTYGIHIEGWAILDYVTHLLKGALMFTTIVLIGTGWAFIKHVLSDKEKKIFMIVIPLQVLDNVAAIIMEESEEGETSYLTWKDVFVLVDLLCCGAILFPVIWSIRHLQEASQTDGKAAVNLRKLKLFRHFYIMIVCYIYFSRIIVQLLKITVPFQYEWLDEMFYEMAAFVFFVLTGYKFRPASNNPYFQIPQDESDLEMDQIITHSGITEGLKKVNRHKENEEDGSSSKRESSLDYD